MRVHLQGEQTLKEKSIAVHTAEPATKNPMFVCRVVKGLRKMNWLDYMKL